MMNGHGHSLLEKLQAEKLDKGAFDIFPYLTLNSLDIICGGFSIVASVSNEGTRSHRVHDNLCSDWHFLPLT